jgi:RNA polymerase sigma factor (sigma-70 family)
MTIVNRLSFLSPSARRFDTLVRPHLPSLYAFAFRLHGNPDDAEDLVQEVLAKLYARASELAGIRDLRPWLQRVLYNQFVDGARRQRSRPEAAAPEHADYEIEDPTGDPGWHAEGAELSEQIDRALARLDHDQRALVVLHFMEGHTLEELTRVFDAPLGTLKSRLHRARAKLKHLLEMEPFAPGTRVVDIREQQPPADAMGNGQ